MIRGLTVWQPWAWAIVRGLKSIENRTWRPWDRMIGHWIAVHSGRYTDWTGIGRLAEILSDITEGANIKIPCDVDQRRGIVGVVRLDEVVTRSDSSWFEGPFGWCLSHAVMFRNPVECRGHQGLWEIDPGVLEQVRIEYSRIKLA